MALRFMDGFDSYVTADLPEKWSSAAGSISAGNGRRGTASARMTTSPLGKNFDAQPTWIVGFAMRITSIAACDIVRWNDAGTQQVELRVVANGRLWVTNNGTSRGITTNPVIFPNTYHYIEFRVTIHNTTGSATVIVDGVTVISATNIDTQTTANAHATQLSLGPNTSLGTFDMDDVYVCDGTGSVNNTPLGDCRIDTLFPNGDGSNSAWSLSTGATHSTLVDETTPNDDTDYILTSTAGARDTHTLGNLPVITSPTIRGIQHSISARKDDAGTRQIKSCLKSGATTQVHATTHTLSTSYLYYQNIWETDPDTTAAWTTSAIDALEAGVENQ